MIHIKKISIEEQEKKHNRKVAVIGATLAVSYSLSAIYLVKRLKKKRKKPVYKEPNPFTILSRQLNTDIGYNGQGMMINFIFNF